MTDPDLHRRGGSATYVEAADGTRTLVSHSPEHAGGPPVQTPVQHPVEEAPPPAPKAKEARK